MPTVSISSMNFRAPSLEKHSSTPRTLHRHHPSSSSKSTSVMSSLPPIPFPPPLLVLPAHNPDEHGDTSIVNSSLEPQPLPTPSIQWYFDKEQLLNTPSRRGGIDEDKELTYRQQSANFIQDMGQRLQVNQLCINTAIVYMHRFYMYHSFQHFQKNAISTASIFLAAKVEEQPRKLEYIIKIAHYCLYRDSVPPIDVKSDNYLAQSRELVSNENILLQSLGFDVSVDHPHTHVVKCCQLVRASKDLAQTSYFMATNSLHLSMMCLEYPPSVVACVCIHLACKWSNWEIPRSKEGKEWYYYVDGSVTPQQLESLTSEFLTIFNKSPSRLKKRILNLSNATSGGSGGGGGGAITSFPTHFTVDRNSSGAQTIKARSRSPSPTSTAATVQSKPLTRPPNMSAKQSLPPPGNPIKPLLSSGPPVSFHSGTKQNPVPPGYPAQGKQSIPNKLQFSYGPPMENQPVPPGPSHGMIKHTSKPGQSYPSRSLSSTNGGVHKGPSGNRPHPYTSASSSHHPSYHQNDSQGYGLVPPQHQQQRSHHGGSTNQIQPIGSHLQSLHHNHLPMPRPAQASSPQQPSLSPAPAHRHSVLKPLALQPPLPLPTNKPQSTASLPPLSFSTSFPLLASEIGLITAGNPGSAPSHVFGGNSHPQTVLPIKDKKVTSPRPSDSIRPPPPSFSATTLNPDSHTSSKKRKKEHKRKKNKDHRGHKDKCGKVKEEKKHKKDKRRDKDSPDKPRSSKRMKHSKSSESSSGTTHHVQDNPLKIKITTSRDGIETKSSRNSVKSIQPNQVVYY